MHTYLVTASAKLFMVRYQVTEEYQHTYVHMRARAHTYTHTHTQTNTHTHARTPVHTCERTPHLPAHTDKQATRQDKFHSIYLMTETRVRMWVELMC